MGGDDNRLDYAPRFRWRRRRVVFASLAVALLLCSAGTWRWWPGIRDRVVLLHQQHRCMTYRAPTDRVIFTNETEEGRRLLDIDPAYRSFIPRARPRLEVWYRCEAWRAFAAGG